MSISSTHIHAASCLTGPLQFRSVSQELYGCEDYHGAVRRAAVERLRACREEFEPFLG